jgi:hypothetical protein
MTAPNPDLLEQAKDEIAIQEYYRPWIFLTDQQQLGEIDKVAHRYFELMEAAQFKKDLTEHLKAELELKQFPNQ